MVEPRPSPSPEPSFILRGHNAIIHSLAFLSPSAGILVASDESGLVRGWNLHSRRSQFEFFAAHTPVLAVRALSDDILFTQDKSGFLRLWDIETCSVQKAPLTCNVEHKADIHSFCKSVLLRAHVSHGEAAPVAFPHGSGSVGIWDTRSNVVAALISPHSGPTDSANTGACTALCALDGRHLCGAFEDGAVRVWDVRSQWPLCTQGLHTEPVFALSALPATSPAAAACASGGADGAVVISRIQGLGGAACSVTEKARMPVQGAGKKGVSGLSVRGDGKVAAAGCWDGRVRLYGVRRVRQLGALQCHAGGVQAVEFSLDGRWLASGGEDARVALWSVCQEEQGAA